jgi:hypothetical protein
MGHDTGDSDDEDEQEDYEGDERDNKVTMPSMTFLAGKGKNEKNTAKLMKGLITCLSVAEMALREASGTRGPIKCWGCQDVKEYQHDCFHRWTHCPRKHDARTIAAFQKNLLEYQQRMNANRSVGIPLKTDGTTDIGNC